MTEVAYSAGREGFLSRRKFFKYFTLKISTLKIPPKIPPGTRSNSSCDPQRPLHPKISKPNENRPIDPGKVTCRPKRAFRQHQAKDSFIVPQPPKTSFCGNKNPVGSRSTNANS